MAAQQLAWTPAGGLLYLVRLVGQLGIPRALLEHPFLRQRPLRWSLYQLAHHLLRLAPDDPAALAFAGLQPQAPLPTEAQPRLASAESAALDDLALQMVAALRSLLRERELADADLLTWLCLRPAQIIADLGWFEVRMPMDAIEVRVRMAGLDLDPGFVPYLGTVIKFVYC